MYGFPLTIYLLSTWMGNSYPVLNPFTHSHGHLWLVFLGLADSPTAMAILHIVSNALIFIGLFIIQDGWLLIHNSAGKRLVTEGVYAYIRHPQYSGIFLITVGFLLQWPTIVTLLMWPILMFAYYRLAMREERDVEQDFGAEYRDYKKRVPAFVPHFRKARTNA
jgi:methanethiol S-methyltransferase